MEDDGTIIFVPADYIVASARARYACLETTMSAGRPAGVTRLPKIGGRTEADTEITSLPKTRLIFIIFVNLTFIFVHSHRISIRR